MKRTFRGDELTYCFQLLYFLIYALQPVLVPFCFVTALGTGCSYVMEYLIAARDAIIKRLHQIPVQTVNHVTYFSVTTN